MALLISKNKRTQPELVRSALFKALLSLESQLLLSISNYTGQHNYLYQIFLMATSDDDYSPQFSYWHVWTDDEGVSHQTLCELTTFARESMGGEAAPQWNNRLSEGQTKIIFSELPAGWQGTWHENPQPQWIIPLSGRWFVETMDGERVEMGPGDISFGGDQNTKPDKDGRKGHLSGTIGSEPARLVIVQLSEEGWRYVKPGDFG